MADRSPEDTAEIKRVRAVAAEIKRDMEADTHAMEGQVASGPLIAEHFGNVRAAISALAGMVDKLAEEVLRD